MGYTIGRRLTFDFIKEQALKCKTRSEFQNKDHSCYTTARTHGWLDNVCSHMKPCEFSIPQRICKQIFDNILQLNGDYNTRKIITPFELDIYYPDLKLAVEYCGKGWHQDDDSIRRDNRKKELCNVNNIKLLCINETNRRYEEDIKNQTIGFLKDICDISKKLITREQIMLVKIDYKKLYEIDDFDIEKIKSKIENYNSVKEFRKENEVDWNVLQKLGLLSLLDPIRVNKSYTTEQLFAECKKINDYSDFIKSNLYQVCYDRGILEEVSSHMIRHKRPDIQEDEIIKLAQGYRRRCDFKADYPSQYRRAIKLGLLQELFPISYKGFRSKYFVA